MIDIETVELSAFYPDIKAECRGVPEFEINRVVPRAAVDLLRRSRLWRETVEQYPVYPDGESFALDDSVIGSEDAVVLDVAAVFLYDEATRLARYSSNPMSRDRLRWRAQTSTEFSGYCVDAAKTITLLPALEDDADPVEIDLALILIPTITATTLPEFLFNEYVEIIAAGAKSRLMLIPDTSWFNPQLAAHYRSVFWAGVAEACRMAAKFDIDARNDKTRRRR